MRRQYAATIATLLALVAGPARAADHRDGPGAVADPTADVNDVFVWTSPDQSRINLALTVTRNATAESRFSDQVLYVFHTTSKGAFLDGGGVDTDVICQFSAAQRVQCWVGDQYVTGNASGAAGIQNDSGSLRVFAGLRNDPFFFNLAGFGATTRAVTAAAPSLTFDPAGCPALDAATSNFLVTSLATAPGGGAAVDSFVGENTLALVLQVEKGLLTRGGPIVGVWGATYRR